MEEKGFSVRDRRSHHAEGEGETKETAKEATAGAESATEPEEVNTGTGGQGGGMSGEAPPIDFSAFVFSLAHSALIYMGLEKHPDGGEQELNMVAARQNIDILGMLEEKTHGNLSTEETELVTKLLYTLRMGFVEVTKAQASN